MTIQACKFSHNSSLVIVGGTKIYISSTDFENTLKFELHQNFLSNPVFVDECKVHAFDSRGSAWEITARGHSEIDTTFSVSRK